LKDDVYLAAVQNLVSYLTENSFRRKSLVNVAERVDTCHENLYEMHKSAVYKDAKFLMLR